MLRMDQYEHIRTAHRVYGQSISEIARITGHSRNTIRKALSETYDGYSLRQYQPFPVLGPFQKTIDVWLSDDRERPRKQRHTARRIFDRLTHRAHIIECTWDSYRLKQSLKGGKKKNP